MRMIGRLLVGVVLAVPVWGAGCARTLFSDTSHGRDSMKYYDDDSATMTTEKRHQSNQMGFGFPTGPDGQ